MTINLNRKEVKRIITLLECEILDHEQILDRVSSPHLRTHYTNELEEYRGILRKFNSVFNERKDKSGNTTENRSHLRRSRG